ncbi:MAG: YkgJ family cysteine cluster protein [Candidatus Melainabacteria bacterium]|nr:YkgJ family cysteine cluster protein [Candidatus Melainabacteria bacterium]
MPNLFETVFDLPKPQCCSQGDCCKGASPSVPYHELLQRAAQGDEFARGFFSLMEAYPSHEAAQAVVPGLVERTLKAAAKSDKFPNPELDVVFYHCRYLQADNRCGVYEDRPQFCRDYPDTPFVVMAPGCAFEDWGASCRQRYQAMKNDVAHLNELRATLNRLKSRQEVPNGALHTIVDDPLFRVDNDTSNLTLVLSLTDLYVASPLCSYWL